MKRFLPLISLLFVLPYSVLAQRDNSYIKSFPEKSIITSSANVFGQRVALDENIAVIGSNHGEAQQGITYVYKKENGVWGQVAKLKASESNVTPNICENIVVQDGYIVLANSFDAFHYYEPEGGWMDMTENKHESFGNDYPYMTSLAKITSSDKQIGFYISGSVDATCFTTYKKEGDGWSSHLDILDNSIINPIAEGDQVIDENYDDKKLNVYSQSDYEPYTVFQYIFPEEILSYAADYGKLLVSLENTDELILYVRSEEGFTQDLPEIQLTPSEENHWTPTEHSSITENMIATVYKDNQGNLSVLCFEKTGDEWTDMNETAIIPLPIGLSLPETGMFAMSDTDIIFSGGGTSPNKAFIYSKIGEKWADGYTTSEITQEQQPIYGYYYENFSYSMSSYDDYSVILDKGKSDLGNIGRIGIYKDAADGALEMINSIDYDGETKMSYYLAAICDEIIAVVATELSTAKHFCHIYKRTGDDWTNTTLVASIDVTRTENPNYGNDVERICLSNEHLILQYGNDRIRIFDRPEAGWQTVEGYQTFDDIYIEGQIDLYNDQLAVILDDEIGIYNYNGEEWETTPTAKLNFRNALPYQNNSIGQLTFDGNRIFLGTSVMNDILDDVYRPGHIFVYTRNGEEWNDQNAPQSIIPCPNNEDLHCGLFGKGYVVNGQEIIANFGGWGPEYQESWNTIYAVKLDDNNKAFEYSEVMQFKSDLSFGRNLSINDNRVLISYNGDDEKGENTGAIYGKLLSTIDYIPVVVAVEETPESNMLRIYPNPVQDQLHIELKQEQLAQISIYDIHGRLMDSFEMEGTSTTINTSALPKGTYVLKVLSGDQVNEMKVVK